MFIKLTEITSLGKAEKPLVLNKTLIQSFSKAKDTDDTHIRMADKSYYFVRQSEKEIWDLIHFDNTKAPVIMTADEANEYLGPHDVKGNPMSMEQMDSQMNYRKSSKVL